MRKWSLSLNPYYQYYPYFEMRSLAGGVPRTANLKLKTDIKNNPQCSKKSLIVKLQQSYRIDHDDHGASKFNSNTTHSIPVSVGYLFDPVGYV